MKTIEELQQEMIELQKEIIADQKIQIEIMQSMIDRIELAFKLN